jgi:NADPH:quinone reductase-like Zn-dependent oxidoreductase
MRAVALIEYGPPDSLQLRDAAVPVPKAGQVLVRVRAASVNPMDWHIMRGSPIFVRLIAGLPRPKAKLGYDIAGVVESVGPDVTDFRAGDEVFGTCRGGALAEYASVPAKAIIHKPPQMTFEQAAATPVAAFTALRGLRDKGGVRPGCKVLINGAAGGVGTFATQFAKVLGAEVTGVCSTRNVEMVRQLGADHVIDYTQEDFTAGDRRYDLLFDNVNNHSLSACRRVLTRTGTHLIVGGSGSAISILFRVFAAPVVSLFSTKKAVPLLAFGTKADLMTISDWIQTGKVRPVIDRCYRLSQTAEAIRYLETGHARGKVVVRVE